MPTAAEIRASARAQARAQLRDAVLDSAYAAAVAGGWSSVRMGTIANEVGISRQGLHNEFGTKEALGQALVMREAEAFLLGVRQALDAAEDPVAGAATQALVRLAENPLLQSIIGAPADDTLLPMLTTRSGPLLERAAMVLVGWADEHMPAADPRRVAELADVIVRLVISYAVMPGDPPEVVGRRLAGLFEAGLG